MLIPSQSYYSMKLDKQIEDLIVLENVGEIEFEPINKKNGKNYVFLKLI